MIGSSFPLTKSFGINRVIKFIIKTFKIFVFWKMYYISLFCLSWLQVIVVSTSSPIFKGSLLGLRQFLAIENHLKMMKNTFYFMLKSLFVLEVFAFLPNLFGYVENGLILKLWLIWKCMTSQTGQQVVTIHILLNISRSKGNHQGMKFC